MSRMTMLRNVAERSRSSFRSLLLLFAILFPVSDSSQAAESRPPVKTSPGLRQTASNVLDRVTLRGRVVCLPEEKHRTSGVALPSRHEHIWAFRTASGDLYTILRGRYSEAIFQDERVRAKELQLRARVLPKSQAIEVLTVHSIREGVVQDLYYYCDVCAIKSVSPAICACCQGPVELMEKPLSQRED